MMETEVSEAENCFKLMQMVIQADFVTFFTIRRLHWVTLWSVCTVVGFCVYSVEPTDMFSLLIIKHSCCLAYWVLQIWTNGFALWWVSNWNNTAIRMPSSCYSCAYMYYGSYEQNTCIWYCVVWAVYKSKEGVLSGEILQNGGVNPWWSRISNIWMVYQTVHRECSFYKFRFMFT